MPQLVIIADRVSLGQPPDADPEAPVMGGFAYALPDESVDYSVNVHDVHVDKELGSYANVSVLYVIPDEVQVVAEPDDEGDLAEVIQLGARSEDEQA